MDSEEENDFISPDKIHFVSAGPKFPTLLEDAVKEYDVKVMPAPLMTVVQIIHPESIIPGDVVGRMEVGGRSYVVLFHAGTVFYQSEQTGITVAISPGQVLSSILTNAGRAFPDIDDASAL